MGLTALLIYCLLILHSTRKAISRPGPSSSGSADSEGGRSAFFVNNRSGSALSVALSIIVSCVGASATIGMIGLAFQIGAPAFWWLGSGCFGLGLLSLLLARKVRESGAYTMPQLVEAYLGQEVRPLIALVIVMAWLGILAAQFSALTEVLKGLTGLPGLICLGLGYGLIVLHTLGGQAAVMRLDRLQALILLTALITMLFWLSGRNPGWVSQTRIELVNRDFPASKLIYFLLVVGGNYLVCPMLFGRFLSARNETEAMKGGFIAVGGLALAALVIVGIGLAGRGLLPSDLPGDQALPAALALAPAWLNILISLALVSAIVSSADSCLLTAGTVLAHDLLKTDKQSAGRACVIGLGFSGLILSLWGRDILAYLLMAYDVYVCGVVTPVFIGMVLGRNRISAVQARRAVLLGGSLGAAAALSGNFYFSYAGILVSLVICLWGARPKVDR